MAIWALLAAVALGAFGIAVVLVVLLLVGGASVIAGMLAGTGWPEDDSTRAPSDSEVDW